MEAAHTGEISALLGRVRDGVAGAREALLPLVYADLERIAAAYVGGGGSLEPRGLVHELYLRLAAGPLDARDRKHFFSVAALAMRQILADRARRRRAAKRGGDAVRVTLSGLVGDDGGLDLLAIEGALTELERLAPRQARVVELRALVGLTAAETADALDISERTVQTEWRLARAWLSRALGANAAAP